MRDVISFFIYSDKEKINQAFLKKGENLEEVYTEECIICDKPIPYMITVGKKIYPVCLGACERRLVDMLVHQVLFGSMEVHDDWNPTWNYIDVLPVIEKINHLGYYVGLLQEPGGKWRCIASTTVWSNDVYCQTIVDTDPLLALCKMLIFLDANRTVLKRTKKKK